MSKKIVLIGFPQSGKTVLGQRLAKLYGCEWFDLDGLLVNQYQAGGKTAQTPRQIWDAEGEVFFRSLERRVLKEFFAQVDRSDKRVVLSLGGGAVLDGLNHSIVRKHKEKGSICIVTLTVDPHVLYDRMKRNGFPRVIDANNPEESFHNLYVERSAVYGKLANFVFDSSGTDLDALARKLYEQLEEEGA